MSISFILHFEEEHSRLMVFLSRMVGHHHKHQVFIGIHLLNSKAQGPFFWEKGTTNIGLFRYEKGIIECQKADTK